VKRVVLCADDFGMSRGVDSGILRLLAMRRLTAVSCLVDGPDFAADAGKLLAHREAADLGLHFDLTTGFGAAPRQALPALLLRAWLGVIDSSEVGRRLEAQLDRFERLMGRRPDFADGHQHVHQFPRVRDALLAVLARRFGRDSPYIRCTVSRHPSGIKARVVGALGGRSLRSALDGRGVPYNRDFGGVYGLDPHEAYGTLMKAWMERIDDGGLILCHPGEPEGAVADPIVRTRAAEFHYLASPEFFGDCAAAGVTLARFSECRSRMAAAPHSPT
jgi:chitin disaccharide deacetylase